MGLDHAVDLRFHHRSMSETLRLDYRWDTLLAEHVTILRPKPHDFTLQSSHHYVALLNAYRKDGETIVDSLPRSTLRNGRGKLIFIPAGCRLQGWAQPATSPIAFTAAYIDPSVCTWPNDGTGELVPMLHFEHPFLGQMMMRLQQILAQPEIHTRIYMESFAVILISEIMRSQAIGLSQTRGGAGGLSQVKGGLASWRCRIVCEYIEDHLAEDITLVELAAIAQLSPYHFCRAFKQAVGEPPHRYQMTRRIELAKARLADPSLSVSDVAAAVGYGSPSRFSALFRQLTGHSPRSYRRNLG